MTTTAPADEIAAAKLCIADVRRRHRRGQASNPVREYCTRDSQDWPCDTIAALEACETIAIAGMRALRDAAADERHKPEEG